MTKRLSELLKGESGTIKKIENLGALNRRLRDMGLFPGVDIRVEGKAPLGDPIQIKVKGLSLALRKNEAFEILIDTHEKESL